MTIDGPVFAIDFPADERAENALWLAELIRGLRQRAEDVASPEVVAILDEAYAVAREAANMPDRSVWN